MCCTIFLLFKNLDGNSAQMESIIQYSNIFCDLIQQKNTKSTVLDSVELMKVLNLLHARVSFRSSIFCLLFFLLPPPLNDRHAQKKTGCVVFAVLDGSLKKICNNFARTFYHPSRSPSCQERLPFLLLCSFPQRLFLRDSSSLQMNKRYIN